MRLDRRPEDQAVERLRRIERDVERQLREAAERGEPPAPEWVDLRREIQEARARLVRRVRSHRQWLTARAAGLKTLPAERILDAVRATDEFDRRFQEELAAALGELNAKIARHNLHARVQLLQLVPLDAERLSELAREE